MTKFVALRPKTYSYLKGDGNTDSGTHAIKKAKRTRKCVIKRILNDYQQDSKVLYTFVPNKPFGSSLEISPRNHIFLKTFNSQVQEIKVWFTDQNRQPLEVEVEL